MSASAALTVEGSAASGFDFPSFARWTAAAAFILVCAGASVTSTGSALAVPDWPLSFGKFFPPMTGGVLFEHGHRMIAGVVALMIWSLAIWAGVSRQARLLRLLSYAAAAIVIVQALLGGLTVLMRLPPPLSISHACLGQTLFCLLWALCEAAASGFALQVPALKARPRLWRWGLAAFSALYIQLIFGAILRHSDRYGFLHYGWALVAAGSVLALAFVGLRSRVSQLRFFSAFLGLAVLVQVCLGVLSLWRRMSFGAQPRFGFDALLTASHVALGALLLGASLIWTMRAYQSP